MAPWNYALHLDTIRTWQLLAACGVSRLGWMSFSTATIAFLVLGIVLAFGAALLRTWGLLTWGILLCRAAASMGAGGGGGAVPVGSQSAVPGYVSAYAGGGFADAAEWSCVLHRCYWILSAAADWGGRGLFYPAVAG